MKKICILNYKGGVAKTTSMRNIGAFFAGAGKKVLCVDLDPSANLTTSFGVNWRRLELHAGHVLLREKSVHDVLHWESEHLALLPGHPHLTSVRLEIERTCARRYEVLAFQLRDVRDFDYVLFDTPPEHKNTLSQNGLAAADYLIIPTRCEHFSVVEGLPQVISSVTELKREYINEGLQVLAIVPQFFERIHEHISNHDKMVEYFGDLVTNAKVRRNVTLAEASRKGTSIFSYKGSTGYDDYSALSAELLCRMC